MPFVPCRPGALTTFEAVANPSASCFSPFSFIFFKAFTASWAISADWREAVTKASIAEASMALLYILLFFLLSLFFLFFSSSLLTGFPSLDLLLAGGIFTDPLRGSATMQSSANSKRTAPFHGYLSLVVSGMLRSVSIFTVIVINICISCISLIEI